MHQYQLYFLFGGTRLEGFIISKTLECFLIFLAMSYFSDYIYYYNKEIAGSISRLLIMTFHE